MGAPVSSKVTPVASLSACHHWLSSTGRGLEFRKVCTLTVDPEPGGAVLKVGISEGKASKYGEVPLSSAGRVGSTPV